MAVNSRSLLGRGPSFPYKKSGTGGLASTEDINRINQSLFLIFETPKGSRLMMPEFGSDLRKYRFDPLDKVLMERIRYTIEFLADQTAIDNSTLYISISYRIINTDVTANYVYPYKLSTYDTLDISYD